MLLLLGTVYLGFCSDRLSLGGLTVLRLMLAMVFMSI